MTQLFVRLYFVMDKGVTARMIVQEKRNLLKFLPWDLHAYFYVYVNSLGVVVSLSQ